MRELEFAYVGLGAHEEVVYSVATELGDYGEHLRLLKSGELDAAGVGSTVSPEHLAADEGLRLLLFFGDELQIPTTGVAVDPTTVALDDPRVKSLVRANVRALRALLDDPALGAAHVRRLLRNADGASARTGNALAAHRVARRANRRSKRRARTGRQLHNRASRHPARRPPHTLRQPAPRTLGPRASVRSADRGPQRCRDRLSDAPAPAGGLHQLRTNRSRWNRARYTHLPRRHPVRHRATRHRRL